jgi:hypothetical protein
VREYAAHTNGHPGGHHWIATSGLLAAAGPATVMAEARAKKGKQDRL